MSTSTKDNAATTPDEKKQALSDLRRRQILAAALGVFSRNGFAGTHVEDIARDAGLAKGTVYLYFPSKQAVYRGVLLDQFCALNQMTREMLERTPGIENKIRAYVRTRLDYCDSQSDFLRIMLTEVGNVAGSEIISRAELQELCSNPVNDLAQHLVSAVEEGEIAPVDGHTIAWMIADLVRGASGRRVLGKADAISAEQQTEVIMQTLWAGLAPAPTSVRSVPKRQKVAKS